MYVCIISDIVINVCSDTIFHWEIVVDFCIILTSLISTCRLYSIRQKPANGTQCPTLTTDSHFAGCPCAHFTVSAILNLIPKPDLILYVYNAAPGGPKGKSPS